MAKIREEMNFFLIQWCNFAFLKENVTMSGELMAGNAQICLQMVNKVFELEFSVFLYLKVFKR